MKGREYETAGRARGRGLVRILDCNNNCKLISERVVKRSFQLIISLYLEVSRVGQLILYKSSMLGNFVAFSYVNAFIHVHMLYCVRQ